MSRTLHRIKTFGKSNSNSHRKNHDKSKTQVEEFLEEYEQKNQNPFIKLRSI